MHNAERAANAHRAIDAYWHGQGEEDMPTKIGDLMCDLLHVLSQDAYPPLAIPTPPPELDSGYRNPHACSTHPYAVLARSLNHYLCEIHPDAEHGEDAVMEPLPEDVDHALTVIREFVTGEVE